MRVFPSSASNVECVIRVFAVSCRLFVICTHISWLDLMHSSQSLEVPGSAVQSRLRHTSTYANYRMWVRLVAALNRFDLAWRLLRSSPCTASIPAKYTSWESYCCYTTHTVSHIEVFIMWSTMQLRNSLVFIFYKIKFPGRVTYFIVLLLE
jgi:hypothetical protein